MAKVFTCAVIGDVLAEPDTVIKAIVTKKAVASRTSFTGTQEELEAAKVSVRKEVQSMAATGSFPTITNSLVAAGGAEVTIQFTLVLDPDTLLNLSPPPNLVLLCYTPVAHATLKTLEMVWVPTLTQMFARPQVVLAATRVETLAHYKIMERIGTKPVTCETIIDKASSWRAVDYVEVSAACNIHLNTLLNALGMAGMHIPAQRMTAELANEQRKDCMKPILSTQSVWTYKRHPQTGRVFYGNRITGQSQWTRPDDFDGEEPELTAAEKEAEGLVKRQLEEQRIREQHERQLEEQMRQEVAVHNERVRELEKRATILTKDVSDLQTRVDDIKDIMHRTNREREDLERRQDQITEARYAKSTVDDDIQIERDINDAKIKLFMLEGRVALADDMGTQTTEIAEAILVNNSLAKQLRELIEEQLKVRRQGSDSQTKIDTLTRLQADATAQLANLANRGPALRSSLLSAESELAASEKAKQQCIMQSKLLGSKLQGTDDAARDRQHHIIRLQAEIKVLDEKIAAKQTERGGVLSPSSSAHPLQAEIARAKLEQNTLVAQLAEGACDCAQYEIACRQKLELLKYVVSEYKFAASKRQEAVRALADITSKRRDEKLLGPAYPVSNPHELQQLQLAIDDRIMELGMSRHRATSPRQGGDKNVKPKTGSTPQRVKTPAGSVTTPRRKVSSASASPASNLKRNSSSHIYSLGKSTSSGLFPGTENATTALSGTTSSANQPSYLISQQNANLNRFAAINELKQVKLLLSSEQRSEESVEVLAISARSAEQRLRSVKAKSAQQSADLKDALLEGLKEISGLERMKGYESASPLERLVSLVDGAVTAAALSVQNQSKLQKGYPSDHMDLISGVTANNDGSTLVTEVANLFTEKMLQSVPIVERAQVAHALNHTASRDLGSMGPAPSGQAIADAISGNVPMAAQSHHRTISVAAKKGVLAASATVAEEATLHQSTSFMLNKAKKLEAHHADSIARYTKHAERIKGLLGVMQSPTAVERDEKARVQQRFHKR